ncbi:MAG: hypothetical protein PGN13_07105 [Patulibacter minatonensis]
MRVPSDHRRRFATAFLVLGCATTAALAPAVASAASDPVPATTTTSAGRGLVGGLVGGVTSTVDSTLVAVSQSTNGAVTLPSVSTITDPLAGTISVVDGAVDQVVAPLPASGTGPRLSLSLPGLVDAAGSAAVALVIGNAGDTACSPLVTLAITGKDGVAVAGGVTQLGQLLPGATNDYALPWPAGLGGGTYAIKTSVTACGTPQSLSLDVKLAATTEAAPDGRSAADAVPGDGGGQNAGAAPTAAEKTSSGGSNGTSVTKGTNPGGSPVDAAVGAAGNGGSSFTGSHAAATTGPTASGASPVDDAMAHDAPVDDAVRDRAIPGQSRFSEATDGPPAPRAILARSGAAVAGLTGTVNGASAVGSSGSSRLGDGSIGAVVRAVPAVIERAAPAIAVLALIASLFLAQERFARRDPKLALAPVGPADDLEFDDAHSFLQRASSPTS